MHGVIRSTCLLLHGCMYNWFVGNPFIWGSPLCVGILCVAGGYPTPDPGTMGYHSIEAFQKVESFPSKDILGLRLGPGIWASPLELGLGAWGWYRWTHQGLNLVYVMYLVYIY